jgi:hypothetical protein
VKCLSIRDQRLVRHVRAVGPRFRRVRVIRLANDISLDSDKRTHLQDLRITSLSYTSTVDWRASPSRGAPPVESSASQQGMRGGVVVSSTAMAAPPYLKETIGP